MTHTDFQLENIDIDINEILNNLEGKKLTEEEDETIFISSPSYKPQRVGLWKFLKSFGYSTLKRGWSVFLAFYIGIRNIFKKKKDKIGKENVRIVQLVSTYIKNDAIGNDVTQIAEALDKLGYSNCIVTTNTFLAKNPKVYITLNYKPRKNDIFLYHMCIGSKPMTRLIKRANVHEKIMIYHNITPSKYFVNDKRNRKMTALGRKQLKELAPYFDRTYSDSKFNSEELIGLNYKNNGVLPVFYLDDALRNAIKNTELFNKLDDGITNILFVGRIAYNKAYEDIIKSFYCYHKYFNSNSRLILVGRETDPHYTVYLQKLIEQCNIKENVIWQKVNDVNELATVYQTASLFLVESEHEGFCVPLLEAMLFKIPVLAYSSSAIPDTLGEAGIIFNKKDHYMIASTIDKVLKNNEIYQMLAEKGEQRLKYFSYENTFNSFKEIIHEIINEK